MPTIELHPEPQAVCDALGVAGSELPVELYDNGATHLFVALGSRGAGGGAAARTARRSARSASRASAASRARATAGRCGCSGRGGEDAATGSAAGPLACHLARHGRIAWGDEITISQGAAIGRPSTLYARAEGGAGLIDRVEVGGQAVTVARGEFRLVARDVARRRAAPSAASSSPAGGSCAVRRDLVDDRRQHLGERARGIVLGDPELARDLRELVAADHLADVVGADRLVRAGAEPRARLLGEAVLPGTRRAPSAGRRPRASCRPSAAGRRAARPCRRPCRCRRR